MLRPAVTSIKLRLGADGSLAHDTSAAVERPLMNLCDFVKILVSDRLCLSLSLRCFVLSSLFFSWTLCRSSEIRKTHASTSSSSAGSGHAAAPNHGASCPVHACPSCSGAREHAGQPVVLVGPRNPARMDAHGRLDTKGNEGVEEGQGGTQAERGRLTELLAVFLYVVLRLPDPRLQVRERCR